MASPGKGGPADLASLPESSGPLHDKRLPRVDGAIILLLLVLGIFQIAMFQRQESFGADSSIYMTLARNLLETGRYEFNYRPHTIYPPGFPILLAGISMLTGSAGYDVLVRFMPVFSTLALVVWYFVLKEYAGRLAAGASCLLVATSAPLFQTVTQAVLSDTAFCLVSGLALWCLIGLDRRNQPRPPRIVLFAGALLFTTSAALIRSVGVALCAGMLAWAFAAIWRRGPRTRIASQAAVWAAVIGFVTFAAWTGWARRSAQVEYQGQHMVSYSSQFVMKDPHQPEFGKASVGEMVLRMASNVPIQSSYITSLLTRISWVAPIWYSPLTVLPFVLVLCGLAACVYENRGILIAAYFLAYFSVYLLWPFDEGPRFMLPVAPLAFVLIWRGVIFVGNFLRTRLTITLAFMAILAAVLTLGAVVTHLPGLQARVSMAFWLAITVLLTILLVLARRAAPAQAHPTLNSFSHLVSAHTLKGVVVVLCAIGIFQQVGISRTNLAPDASQFTHHPSADCAVWLRTAGDGVLMAGQDAILHRLTGRRVVSFPITSDAQVIVETATRENVRYLIVNDRVKDEYFLPPEEDRYQQIERAYPGMFELVHKGPGYRVLEKRGR